jgi:hypothetical protein
MLLSFIAAAVLQQPVTVSRNLTLLNKLVPELGKELGLELKVSGATRWESLHIRVKNVPVQELLDNVALAANVH